MISSNSGRRWTDKDDEELLRLIDEQIEIAEIATITNRSIGSIFMRLMKLGRVETEERAAAQSVLLEEVIPSSRKANAPISRVVSSCEEKTGTFRFESHGVTVGAKHKHQLAFDLR
jgi:hypothetical protein